MKPEEPREPPGDGRPAAREADPLEVLEAVRAALARRPLPAAERWRRATWFLLESARRTSGELQAQAREAFEVAERYWMGQARAAALARAREALQAWDVAAGAGRSRGPDGDAFRMAWFLTFEDAQDADPIEHLIASFEVMCPPRLWGAQARLLRELFADVLADAPPPVAPAPWARVRRPKARPALRADPAARRSTRPWAWFLAAALLLAAVKLADCTMGPRPVPADRGR